MFGDSMFEPGNIIAALAIAFGLSWFLVGVFWAQGGKRPIIGLLVVTLVMFFVVNLFLNYVGQNPGKYNPDQEYCIGQTIGC